MGPIGIFSNTDRSQAMQWTAWLVDALNARGRQVVLAPEVGRALSRPELERAFPTAWGDVELAIVLGGDGTLLRAAKAVAPLGLPVLGINTGHLGFLTELEADELPDNLEALLAGGTQIEERMMLRATVLRDEKPLFTADALNDAVITRGPLARMVHLRIDAGGTAVTDYAADGIIISTPTGSTAYALSAGGPICYPDLQILLVTPICPHTFNSRSLVVPAAQGITVDVLNAGELLLTIDGQLGCRFLPGDRLRVERAQAVARLVRRPDYHFYDVLRRKLAEPSRKIGGSFGP